MTEPRRRMVSSAGRSLAFNLTYGVYHGAIGIMEGSRWSMALWGYYTVLATTRFAAILWSRKTSVKEELFLLQFTGWLTLLLGTAMAAVNFICLRESIVTQYDTIAMITVAAYTFLKIGLAIQRGIRQQKLSSPLLAALRRISYADIAVSVLTLQRSMLVTFGELPTDKLIARNALTGAGVYLFLLCVGVLNIQKKVEVFGMTKSKIKAANQKIANTVVNTYQKIEDSAVTGYSKIEDAFVAKYLAKDDETVEQAKERLQKKLQK